MVKDKQMPTNKCILPFELLPEWLRDAITHIRKENSVILCDTDELVEKYRNDGARRRGDQVNIRNVMPVIPDAQFHLDVFRAKNFLRNNAHYLNDG